jgi:multidrug resistance protein MdtO
MTGTVPRLVQLPWTTPRDAWWELLRAELTLAPERTARMVRMTVLVMGVVLISMALRVPEASVSAYMIFFLSRDDAPSTVKSGIGLIVAVTGAVLVALLVLSFTDGEPALRLGAMAALTFGAMYAQRSSPKLGLLGFGIGFVATMLLVYVDVFQTPELLTRAVCWLWVVIAYPAALLVLSESTFGTAPEVLLRRGVSARLAAVADFLEELDEDGGRARRRLERLERMGTGGLVPYARRGAAALAPLRASLTAEVQTLLVIARQLPSGPLASSVRSAFRQAAASCRSLGRAVLGEQGIELEAPAPAGHDFGEVGAASLAAVLPLLASIRTLTLGVKQLREVRSRELPPAAPEAPPTEAEASERRTEALQFASKVTLAALGAYVLYTALDWQGIHTAMITCFFVAQESVGATIHKFTLRIAGAVVGGALGIASLVFVLPHLDSAGGLALLVGAVTLFATWFATGSQRIAYFGWQIAIAYFIAVLHGFSRSTKLVVARDRVLGIILGNILISIVFVHLWPVRVGTRVANAVARALDALAALLSIEDPGPESEARSAGLQESFFGELSKAQELGFLGRFEPGRIAGEEMLPALSALFIPARALSLSAPETSIAPGIPEAERWRTETVARLRRALALQLTELAEAIREGRTPRVHAGRDAFEDPLRSFAAVGDAVVRKALDPLRSRLEWLGMIGEQLAVLAPPAGRLALARGSR